MKHLKLLFSSFLLFTLTSIGFSGGYFQEKEDPPWFVDWGVDEGFAISLDTDGYDLPTAIAFVPNPGDNPEDPLYFVTELRGKIKVVTNDRVVHTFADAIFEFEYETGLENLRDEFGLSSICLDSEYGYVFVTLSFRNEDGKLHNSIMRFATKPKVFSVESMSKQIFEQPFQNFETGPSHNIGGCQVHNGMLYVGTGDGFGLYDLPLGIDNPLGKILRFTLEGEPAPNNPYYSLNNPTKSENFIWAMGFRNPFGLKIVNGQVFVADNGKDIDRFVRVDAGQDYLWDGSDASIGARATLVFSPAIAPAQLEFYSVEKQLFPPTYADNFFVAATGNRSGIVRFPYDFDRGGVVGLPDYFLTYLGRADTHYSGMVTGLAVGPDGLYFAPIIPTQGSTSGVYKISFDPVNQHPYRSKDLLNPAVLIRSLECTACHVLGGEGNAIGPSLDYDELIPRLEKRLYSEEYLQLLDEIDTLDKRPFTSYSLARQEVRELDGISKYIRWVSYHLLEPKFDNPDAQMPNLNLSKSQAQVIAEYLTTNPNSKSELTITDEQQEQISDDNEEEFSEEQQEQKIPEKTSTLREGNGNSIIERLQTNLPPLRYIHLPFVFLSGVLFVIFLNRIFRK